MTVSQQCYICFTLQGVDHKGKLCVDMSFYTSHFPSHTKPSHVPRYKGCTTFEWVKNMRYYWDTDIDNLLVCMSNSQYIYGYEYLGASPRLVITPLTVSHAFAT